MTGQHFDSEALDRDRVLPRLLKARAAEDGDRPFAVMIGGDTLTYRQTHELSLGWATALRDLGVDQDDRVAVMLPIGLDAVTAWVGIGWLRAWEVPINTEYRGRMLAHILNSSDTETIVIAFRWLDRIAEIAGELPRLKRVIVTEVEGELPAFGPEIHDSRELLAGTEFSDDFAGPEPTDVAAILYTSGTTGASKGVVAPWAQLLACFQQPLWSDFGPEDHRYSPFPMYHLSGKGLIFGAALNGAQVVLKERWRATEFWDDIATYKCTFTWLVGGMASLLYSAPPRPEDAESSLRFALMAPVIPEYREFETRFGLKLATAFGMTELSMPIVSEWNLPNNRTCGRVRAGYEVRVVDENDIPVPAGTRGEFVVRSDTPWTLNIGYLGMPEETVAAWRHGWFHTGDGGWQDEDGNFYFSDRIKDAIRRRGENISSMEVEAEALTHPGIAECAAVGVPCEHGEEDVFIFVVPRAETELDPAELWAYFSERMPRFMVPRYIQFIDELPRTPTARVQKVELRRLTDIGGAAWDQLAVPAGP